MARHPSHGYRLCTGCGLGRIDPWPAPGQAESYDEGYFVDGGGRAGYAGYEADELWHRRTARVRLDRVDAALLRTAPDARQPPGGPAQQPPAGRGVLVDVGGAVGYLADEARLRGWRTATVEVSAWAAGRAAARGLRVVSGLSELTDLTGAVDVVTFFQSLEHLPDPEQALRAASGLLRPGGLVVVETWDVTSRTARWAGSRWQQLSPPSVLWLFSPDGLGTMAARAGLRPWSWQATGKVVSAATVHAQLPWASGRLRPSLAAIGIPYRLDDLVTCVAQKPVR